MRAVVWTDTLQSLVTAGALLTVVCVGTQSVGGFLHVFRMANEGGRIILFNMNPSVLERSSFWTVTVGLTTMWIAKVGVSQCFVQRLLSVPTIEDARKALLIFCVSHIVVKTVICYIGLLMYANYKDCDPLSIGQVAKPDQMLPFYVVDAFGSVPALPGLFVVGVFSAALSTMSTGLNTLAGTVYEDFIKPHTPNATEKQASNIMKWIVIIVGCVSLALVFVVDQLGSTIMQLGISVNGMTMGSLLGLFSLGMFVPRANTKGALCGAFFGMALVGSILVGSQTAIAKGELRFPYLRMSTEGCEEPVNRTSAAMLKNVHQPGGEHNGEVLWLYQISFMYYTFIGATSAFVVGAIVSLLTERPGPVDELLLTPIVRRWGRRNLTNADYSLADKPMLEVNTDAVSRN